MAFTRTLPGGRFVALASACSGLSCAHCVMMFSIMSLLVAPDGRPLT